MPEGDTVLVAARRLHAALAQERLLRTDFRVPAYAMHDLSGRVLREVAARGKHLLLRTADGVTLHTHFGMDGRWDLYRPGRPWRGPDHEVRAVLKTTPWVAVATRLRVLEIFPTSHETVALAHLGPDVLGPDWDPDEAVRRLTSDPDRPVGEALLDQGVMAGPGNVYRSEVCFLRGLDPFAPAGACADPRALVDLVKRAMEANRATGRQITTGDTRRGREQWVYGRAGQPCRRCGTTILRGGGSPERVVFWCPSCQPGSPRSNASTGPASAGRTSARGSPRPRSGG
ncbi:MAG TPA: DNA-formamidopyrimidine glycosylase family protein [Actinomycetota bacterium]